MNKQNTSDNKCQYKRDDGKRCDFKRGHRGLHKHGLLIFDDSGKVLNF